MVSLEETTNLEEFLSSIQTRAPIAGLTHLFYSYPARFSPLFARSAIATFSKPGDLVLDPFMGGGTTLVEALALGRSAIGTDINPLSVFISQVKTTPLSEIDIRAIKKWAVPTSNHLNLHQPSLRDKTWYDAGYQKHLPWPIRKTIELILLYVEELKKPRQQRFVRCSLLKTTQWAIDNKKVIPCAEEFRSEFFNCLDEMLEEIKAYSKIVKEAIFESYGPPICLCLNRSVIGLEKSNEILTIKKKPRLVVTSPPYPGVHVLYHRWQVFGRRETSAPYWIANSLDGNGESYYTFVSRHRKSLSDYFDRACEAFTSVRKVIDDAGMVVQLIAFSDPPSQLPRYLSAMNTAGFKEVPINALASTASIRIWREVPNRKWYATQRGSTAASREVVLLHVPC